MDLAVEDILRALEDKAANRIEVVKTEAQQRVNEIMGEAEKDAAHTRRMRLKKIENSIRSESTSIVYSASLEAKNELIRAQEEVVDEAFKLAGERLSDLRDRDDYPEVFEVLLDECLEYMDGEILLQVRKDDRTLLEKLMADKKVPYRIAEAPLEASGGLIASSADGKVDIQNSFESRLSKAKEKMRLEVSNVLYGS